MFIEGCGMEIGDIVGRKSYNCDIYFKITADLGGGSYALTGINYRLAVTASLRDLLPIPLPDLRKLARLFQNDMEQRIRRINRREDELQAGGFARRPGKVLHIDSDQEYLSLCLQYYNELRVPAVGEQIQENEQGDKIQFALKKHFPDSLVIAGHDSLRDKEKRDDLDSYRSSAFFCDAVRNARYFNPVKDSLVIIAGACQSHYEALIDAGANIASSPGRILIHALDPVFAAHKIAYSSIDKVLSLEEILENTITGREGLGGYQTRGVLREGLRM